MSRRLRFAALTAAVLVIALPAFLAARRPGPGLAAVTSTSPVDGARLVRAPTEIDLSFDRPVDPQRSHVSLLDGSGSASAIGRPRLAGPDRIRQRVSVPAPGDVTVAYHVTFVDGAQATGTLRFTVGTGGPTDAGAIAAPPAVPPDVDDAPVSGHEHGIDPLSAALLAIDGVVGLAAVVLLLRRPPAVPAPRLDGRGCRANGADGGAAGAEDQGPESSASAALRSNRASSDRRR